MYTKKKKKYKWTKKATVMNSVNRKFEAMSSMTKDRVNFNMSYLIIF